MKKLIYPLLVLLLAACGGTPSDRRASQTPAPPSLRFTPTLSASSTQQPIETMTQNGLFTSDTPMPSPTPLPALPAGAPVALTWIDMIDQAAGWGIDTDGRLLRTVDGGATWQDVTPPAGTFEEHSFFALDGEHAWAYARVLTAGDGEDHLAPVIWRTSDGGSTWQPPETPPPPVIAEAYRPLALDFADPEHGWFLWDDATGQGRHSANTYLDRTTDGGKTWEEHYLDSMSVSLYPSLVFLDARQGYISVDTNPYGASEVWLSCYLSRECPYTLWKTDDGGLTFQSVGLPWLDPADEKRLSALPDSEYLNCAPVDLVRILPSGVGGMLNCHDSVYVYFLSADNGQTWHAWIGSGDESFVNPQTGWRLFIPGPDQSNQLQHTTNGGLTWTALKTVAWQSAQFDFVSETAGWAIASDGVNSALVHTTDGGKTWVEIKPTLAFAPPNPSAEFYVFPHMTDADNGWALAYIQDKGPTRYYYFHITDGGRTWQEVTPQDGLSHCGNFFLNNRIAWLLRCRKDEPARLIRTLDGGTTWEVMNEALAGNLSLNFTSANEGWSGYYDVGAGSGIACFLRTDDGGATWQKVFIASTGYTRHTSLLDGCVSVCNICGDRIYYDSSRVMIVYGGDAGILMPNLQLDISTDLGKSWKHLEFPGPSGKYANYEILPQSPVFFNRLDGLIPMDLRNYENGHFTYAKTFFVTHDGGFTWVLTGVAPESLRLFPLAFFSTREGIALCGVSICISRDGMTSWTEIHPNIDIQALPAGGFYDMQFIDLSTGWLRIKDSHKITSFFQTHDSGKTWTRFNPIVMYRQK